MSMSCWSRGKRIFPPSHFSSMATAGAANPSGGLWRLRSSEAQGCFSFKAASVSTSWGAIKALWRCQHPNCNPHINLCKLCATLLGRLVSSINLEIWCLTNFANSKAKSILLRRTRACILDLYNYSKTSLIRTPLNRNSAKPNKPMLRTSFYLNRTNFGLAGCYLNNVRIYLRAFM